MLATSGLHEGESRDLRDVVAENSNVEVSENQT